MGIPYFSGLAVEKALNAFTMRQKVQAIRDLTTIILEASDEATRVSAYQKRRQLCLDIQDA